MTLALNTKQYALKDRRSTHGYRSTQKIIYVDMMLASQNMDIETPNKVVGRRQS